MQQVIDQISPLLTQLVDVLNAEGNAEAAHFFAQIRAELTHAQDEMDLLGLFTFRLANSDEIVHGYGLTGMSVELIDRILRPAIEISAAYSADGSIAH